MWNDDERASEENRTVPLFGPSEPLPPPDRGPAPPEPPTGRDPMRGTIAGPGVPIPDSRADADPSATAPTIGSILLDKYRVERKLGEGGMGSVWLVRHIRLDEPRALKVIGEGIASDPLVRARFELEARILAKLKHPCAVAVHDTGIVGGTAYIEMEYVQGESLRRMLRRGEPTPLPFILWVLRGMCDVLGFAHNKGIVHRDLKPENVMIVTDPETGRRGVKVVDFGIAKIVQADDPGQSMTMHTQGLLGTPAYSSPEQNAFDVVEKTRVPIDHRSDVYSLGVMLYELLTGELPFRGNWTQVLYQHASIAPRPPREVAPAAGIPPAVEAVVLRCLEKSPDRRPSSAAELYNAFNEAAGRSGALEQTADGAMPTPAKAPLQVLTPHPHGTGQVTTSPAPFPFPTPAPPPPPSPSPWRRPIVAAVVVGLVAVAVWAWRRPVGKVEVAPAGGGTEAKASPAVASSPVANVGVSPAVTDYLRSFHPRRRYEPVASAELQDLDGTRWPKEIASLGPGAPRRLVLHGRVYLPPGAEPVEAEGVEGPHRLPLAVAVGEGAARIVYRLIPGGTSWIGQADERLQTPDDKPYHKVAMSPYYLQATETTITQFEPFRAKAGRAWDEDLRDYADYASSHVSQGDADVYPAVLLPRGACAAFAASLGAWLPTEAQWEYAARSRGKRDSGFVWPDPDETPAAMANIEDTRLEASLMAVMSFNTDRTMDGIFDMAGNAREWCRDVHRAYPTSTDLVVDPFQDVREGEPDPEFAIRGGSYLSPRETARVSFRTDLPDLEYRAKDRERFEDVGFRTALEVVVAPGLDRDGGSTAGENPR